MKRTAMAVCRKHFDDDSIEVIKTKWLEDNLFAAKITGLDTGRHWVRIAHDVEWRVRDEFAGEGELQQIP